MNPNSGGVPNIDVWALAAGLRDFVVDLLREERDPWAKLSAAQQAELRGQIEDFGRDLVEGVVTLTAGRGWTAVPVALETLTFKKTIEAKMIFAPLSIRTKHELVNAQGGRIVLVIVPPNLYRPAPQMEMDLDEEQGEPSSAAAGQGGGGEPSGAPEPSTGPGSGPDAPEDAAAPEQGGGGDEPPARRGRGRPRKHNGNGAGHHA